MKQTIQLSVRSVCTFLYRSGSIDSRFSGLDGHIEGMRLHRRLQKQGGENYKAEVPLRIEKERGGFHYVLRGRADGVITTETGLTVDEIKTTAVSLETIGEQDNPDHWAQGCCYAYILCIQRNLPGCQVQITYCQRDTGEVVRFVRSYTTAELEAFFYKLLEEYERWAKLSVEWKEKRDAGLRGLAFPFSSYREGQRKMAVACYRTFQEEGTLFCCAPTGIGKTLSALFPAMKAMGEGYGERVFYLTAKTITRKAAEDALSLLRRQSPLSFRSLTLTAKDKICLLEERACFPEACPYADGYYDRINDAVYKILQREMDLTRDILAAEAQKNKLCPYELALDLAQWCDCVICDYNYLFDPVVRLQRFFEGKGGEYLFLVDEAHNLVDRSREMYSAQLSKSVLYSFKKQLPKNYKKMHRVLNGLNRGFIALRRQCEAAGVSVLEQDKIPQTFVHDVDAFVSQAEIFLNENKGGEWEKDLLAIYFDALFFQRIADLYDAHYTTLLYQTGSDVTVKLFCLDPSSFLADSMELGRATVLFSATLQPLPYYRETLGGGEEARILSLGSPFRQQNLGLFLADAISTKYAHRPQSIVPIADMLADMVRARDGNYIAYFPSYAYMRQVYEVFLERHPNISTQLQNTGMDEAAREDFLAAFQYETEETLLGFCVLGGIFSEGIDLPGNRLIGCAIVGVGLPKIGPEPDAIRKYYDQKNGYGYEFAYRFPGMNKVLQAAGRVIRTEEDRGVVLLIDSRFATSAYQGLFPSFWNHWQRVFPEELLPRLQAYWG